MDKKSTLSQYMTPVWAADCLASRYLKFRDDDIVCEPSCGEGAMLRAVPVEVEAFGVEIDPHLAAIAAERTGRQIIVGDFRTVKIDRAPTKFFGNPPFKASVISGMIRRCFELLPWEGEASFILPAYVMQTASVVCQYAERFDMIAQLLPRTLFPGLSIPLIYCLFKKTTGRTLVGFALFEDARDIEQMPAQVKETLARGKGSVWFEAVDGVLMGLGGEASLDAIYASMAPKRPTGTQFWREKVRQVLQMRFRRTGTARYARMRCVDAALAA